MDSWSDPDTYFADTAIEFLAPFLAQYGFDFAGSSPHSVEFRRGRSTLTVSCDTVMMPTPWTVDVAVGLVGADGQSHSAALWRLLDAEERERAVKEWSFRDSRSLHIALQRLVADGLTRHGPRVWDNDVEVRRVLDEQREEGDRRYADDQRRADLAQARFAFERREYRLALDRYALLDPEDLNAADRRRRYISERELDDGSKT